MKTPEQDANEARQVTLAIELIKAGARTGTVMSLTGLGLHRIRRLTSSIRGQPSPNGSLPYSLEFYVRPVSNQLRSSLFSTTFQHALQQYSADEDVDLGRVLLCAHRLYSRYVSGLPGVEIISLDRAYHLLQIIRSGTMLLVARCRECESDYLYDPATLSSHACPVCRTYVTYFCRSCGVAMSAPKNNKKRHPICGSCDPRLHRTQKRKTLGVSTLTQIT